MEFDSYMAGPPMSVAIAGASGLIGSALVERLRVHGHSVRRLVRGSRTSAPDDRVWDPEGGVLDPSVLDGISAVINLAGEPIAQRWSSSRKEAIRASRVRSTELLARTIAAREHKPSVFISGSAVGYYGDRGDELLDEASHAGTGFLARVCQEWEDATTPAVDAGVRVVLIRTGVVLSATGGALAKMLPPFRVGAGGPIGSGRQWMSWIGLEDQIRAIGFALCTTSLRGPVNLVSPNPVINAEFASTLGRVLARPALLPVPRFALELLYGEMADAAILASQRVRPEALLTARFEFGCATLEQALRRTLDR